MFLFTHRKRDEKKIKDKIHDILDESGLIDGVTVSNDNKDKLRLLDSIYTNRDSDDSDINKDIIASSYIQVLIFGLCVILSLFFVGIKHSELIALFKEKVLAFLTVGLYVYLFNTLVKRNYSNISREELYKIFRDEIEKLL